METWKDIPGFEGLYQASDLGNVRSLITNRVLKPGPCMTYGKVMLHKSGVCYPKFVHHCVLETFVGPRPSRDHEACHGPSGPKDDSLANLRWGTKAENAMDIVRFGTQRGSNNCYAKLTETDVLSIRRLLAKGWLQREVAERFGVDRGTISAIAQGKNWAHVK